MATAAIADELTCPVCLEFYKDPRVIPCQHSICKSCLVALLSKREKDSNCDLQCPCCSYLVNAKNERHIEALPKNFTLASIVCKFQASLKGDKVFPCDLCEDGQKGRAIKKCLQCQFNYCRTCLEQLHPKRGALAVHNLVHIMDAQGEEHEYEDSRSAISSPVSENQSMSTQKYDQLMQVRYCSSCDVIFTKGDQMSAVGCHDHHDTTEMDTAFRTKKEEFQRTLGRLLDQDMELEKGLATISHQIETIRKSVEEKKVELVHRIGEVTKEIESKKILAENRIEEEMKKRVNSLESRLRELEDHKRKTQIKIAAFSELSSLTDEDAIGFFMKLKELQNEIEPVAEDYIKQAVTGTGCDSSLPIEQFMNEIIANATRDICTSERRLQAPDPILAATGMSPQHANMAIQVDNVQSEGTVSADIEWVAIDQVDHYEMSYFCDPEETVLRRNILENRCRLTNLRWDSNYTITVTAYHQDGKTSLDSTVFKMDPKLNVAKPAIVDIPPKKVKMSIKVTNIQIEGTMSADVKWSARYQPSQYEVTYNCNPDEMVVLKKITENRCRLTNLRWDSTYVVKVTTQLKDGTIGFNEKIFQTDPQVMCFPMATTEICNDKIDAPNSLNEFTASDRKKTGQNYNKIGEFSGIVFTPVLTENKHFWTMNFDLSIFRPGKKSSLFFDFGIIDYSSLNYTFGLTNNKAAHTCAIVQANQRNIHLQFFSRTIQVGPTLTFSLEHKRSFQFGFFYDRIGNIFAVLNLPSQNVLHVFVDVQFPGDADSVFAVAPYHTFQKMRIHGTLSYGDCLEEDLSYWMLKIKEYMLINTRVRVT